MPQPIRPYIDTSHVHKDDLKNVLFRRVRRSALLGGLQLEFFFLVFFLPYVVLQSTWFDDQLKVSRVLFDTAFPFSDTTSQVVQTLPQHSYSTGAKISSPYGMETRLFWQWFNNVVYPAVEIHGNGVRLGASSSSILVSNIRFRQLRVNSIPCPIMASAMTKIAQECYPAYSEINEAKADSPFGMDEQGRPYVWSPSWITGDGPYQGTFGTYAGSGFVVDLSFNASIAKQQIIAMQRSSWLDGPQPRAMFLTMSVLDTNSGYVTFVRFLLEMQPTLGTIATWSVTSAPLYMSYSTATSLEILFWISAFFQFCFVLYTTREAYRMLRGGLGDWRFIQNTCGRGIPFSTAAAVWFFLDVIASGIMIAQIVFGIEFYVTQTFTKPVDAALTDTGMVMDSIRQHTYTTSTPVTYYNGDTVILWSNAQLLFTTSILLSTFRIFRYSELFPFMRVFVRTLRRVAFDMLMYFVLLALMTMVYVMCAVNFYGEELYEWNSARNGFMMGFTYLQGTISYNRMVTRPFGFFFAPIFIFSFLFIFLWYIGKVFVAIVYFGFVYERDLIEKEDRDEKARTKPLGVQRTSTIVVMFHTMYQSICRIPNWCKREYEVSDREMLQMLLDVSPQTPPSSYISLAEVKSLLVRDNTGRNVLVEHGRKQLRRGISKVAGAASVDVDLRAQRLFDDVYPKVMTEAEKTFRESLELNEKQGTDDAKVVVSMQEDNAPVPLAVSTMQRTSRLIERVVHNNDIADKQYRLRLKSLKIEQLNQLTALKALKESIQA